MNIFKPPFIKLEQLNFCTFKVTLCFFSCVHLSVCLLYIWPTSYGLIPITEVYGPLTSDLDLDWSMGRLELAKVQASKST